MRVIFVLIVGPPLVFSFFFFNDTATTEIYTLSLHDALPIFLPYRSDDNRFSGGHQGTFDRSRSEEHTSELQSQSNLVCRLLLEKKKKKRTKSTTRHIRARSRKHGSRNTRLE